jgi:two-component system nitrogen regulation sensor histidine kinase NtrY
MARRETTELTPAEIRKRKRESFIIAISLLFIIVLTWAEIHLARLRAAVQLGNKIIIFGLINVIILLIILLRLSDFPWCRPCFSFLFQPVL